VISILCGGPRGPLVAPRTARVRAPRRKRAGRRLRAGAEREQASRDRGRATQPPAANGSPTEILAIRSPMPDALNAQVIAERLTERSERFIFDGKGYRLPNAT
jgi:hypothetical protein